MLSRSLLFLSALALIISLFVPIWRIELAAPQYPEGLILQIYANNIGGNVAIINGLNHYIGMKTLHTDDFIEFTVLPYLISGVALLFIISALMRTKKWVYTSFTAIALFGIIAMVDFWLWEYKYGHNLDPNAAIIVPGMAYQPPLIGYKQLLNFGAFSVPDIGGWLFIGAGAMLLFAVLHETGFIRKMFKKNSLSVVVLLMSTAFFSACSTPGPTPIALNSDNCDNCRMTISDGRFAAELITTKGRTYKFDDIHCMKNFSKDHGDITVKSWYISDFLGNHELFDATTGWFVPDEAIKSPMGGSTAAFTAKELADDLGSKLHASTFSWEEVIRK